MSRATLLPLAAALLCATPLGAQRQPQAPLPEGPGRELVQAHCTGCHGPNQITGSAGYSREGWRALLTSMVALPDAEAGAIAEYLAVHFPERPGRRPVVVPGDATVTIREWMVPTPGQRPHDPLQTEDGAIWWTGQWIDVLGRLDPRTGEAQEFPLPADAGPHGLADDGEGNVWYTGNGDAHVGKLDPRTGEVTVYRTTARDPHTPIFDRAGNLWFTAQNANVIARLDPRTGDLREVTAPSPGSRPYGIHVNSRGVPWVVLFGTHKLARVDPITMEIREYALPSPDARPRRLALSSDDAVWYTDYARGYLGRFDPRTGETKEWPSPSGPASQPYGIAIVDDVVWYSESGPRPNTLVRFDPRTERFQSWVIPSGGGVVRHMMATPDGNVVMALSGVNRVGLVEIRAPGEAR